jgi:hypothetical protein
MISNTHSITSEISRAGSCTFAFVHSCGHFRKSPDLPSSRGDYLFNPAPFQITCQNIKEATCRQLQTSQMEDANDCEALLDAAVGPPALPYDNSERICCGGAEMPDEDKCFEAGGRCHLERVEGENALGEESEPLPDGLEHIPAIEDVESIRRPVQEIPMELLDGPDISQSFNDAAPTNIRKPGLLSTALSSLRDGPRFLGAVLTQLRDLTLRMRTSLET